MKHYFVSYTFSKKGIGELVEFNTMGFGSMKVTIPQLKTYDDILILTLFIKEQNGFGEVAILNWKKIKG
jgi:hypothetical protein